MSFDESFALSDVAVFAEMGETIKIGGADVQAVRLPNTITNTAAEGGFAADNSAKFEISLADYLSHSVRPGSLVQQGAEKWKVTVVTRNGGTIALTCMATSGQGGRSEF